MAGLQGLTVKNIEGESTYFVELGLLHKLFQILPTFSQNVALQKAFKTAAKINGELKIMEFEGAFWKKLNFLSIDVFHFSCQT